MAAAAAAMAWQVYCPSCPFVPATISLPVCFRLESHAWLLCTCPIIYNSIKESLRTRPPGQAQMASQGTAAPAGDPAAGGSTAAETGSRQ